MKKQLLSALLLAAMLLASCGQGGSSDTSAPDDSTTDPAQSTDTQAPEYDLSAYDYKGYEFNLLNVEDIYHMHSQLDREATDGDIFNDTMFERCRKVEEELGITFVETLDIFTEVTSNIRTLLSAGDDTYDAMYVPYASDHPLGAEGLLLNLLDYDGFQFDQPWWDQAVNTHSTIGGALYGATGEAHLMQLDSTWVIYYNESFGERLNLDTPYQLVRDGKWTLDVLNTYCKAAAILNGDDSFAWKDGGNATYGLSTNSNGPLYTMYGFGEEMFGIRDDRLTITAGSDRYYTAAEKLGAMFCDDGRIYRMTSGSVDDEADSYVHMFEIERTLMLATELSKTNRMRDKAYSFGILPYPKFDEEQENYIARNGMAMKFAIPYTAKDPEMSAVVGDALNYFSYTMVKDVFREITIEQKNLRNDDSIDMLNIIFDSLQPNLVYIYGLTDNGATMVNSLSSDIFGNRAGSQASIIDSLKGYVQAAIDKIYE